MCKSRSDRGGCLLLAFLFPSLLLFIAVHQLGMFLPISHLPFTPHPLVMLPVTSALATGQRKKGMNASITRTEREDIGEQDPIWTRLDRSNPCSIVLSPTVPVLSWTRPPLVSWFIFYAQHDIILMRMEDILVLVAPGGFIRKSCRSLTSGISQATSSTPHLLCTVQSSIITLNNNIVSIISWQVSFFGGCYHCCRSKSSPVKEL